VSDFQSLEIQSALERVVCGSSEW